MKIFTTSDCVNCDKAKQYLSSNSIDFEEINLNSDKKMAASLAEKTGYSMVPQIQIDDKFIIGFDQAKIAELLRDD